MKLNGEEFFKTLDSWFGMLVVTNGLYTIPNYFPKGLITYFVDLMPVWLVIIIMSIAVWGIFVALPWGYGKLIKWIYEEYKLNDD